MTTSRINLAIPAQAEYIDVVRLTLFGIANKAGFSYEDIEDMKVAVSEACSNAVLYAYDYHCGPIKVTFELERDRISIMIKDYGNKSVDLEHLYPPASFHNKALSEIGPRGLGIFLMQALMDNVEIRTNFGTEVILTKRIGGKEEIA